MVLSSPDEIKEATETEIDGGIVQPQFASSTEEQKANSTDESEANPTAMHGFKLSITSSSAYCRSV